MTSQPEALRLAESLMDYYKCSDQDIDEAAAELRRQHGEIKSLQAERRHLELRLAQLEAQRKPLTEDEIHHATGHCGVSKYTAVNITRAVEWAHGIKEN